MAQLERIPVSGDRATLSLRERRLLLGVVALALMMVVSAVSGLNVALPDMAIATGATQTQITWIVDVYTVVFVGLLLPAGAVGDRFGRRGILLAGLVLFGGAAAAAIGTSSPTTLIVLRAVMGAGAAAVMPTTLSIITTSFPPDERGRAVGIWVGVAGGGAVIGLFASGILLQFFSWSSFFTLNVTLAVIAVLGTLRIVPRSRDAQAPRLDPVGALSALLGVGGVVFGIIEGPDQGWSDPLTVGAFLVGGVGLVSFVLWELRAKAPMLDPRLFRLRGFAAGTLTLVLQYFGSFGLFFIIMQYLQYIAGLTPLQAACAMLPLPVVLIPLARAAPRIAVRMGLNRIVALGLFSSAIGLAVMSQLGVDFAYWQLAVGLVVFAAGMGLAGTPSTTAIVSSLPSSKQGVASSVNDTSREFGSALGIAILGSILTSAYRSGLSGTLAGVPPVAATHARASIAFIRLGGPRLQALGEPGVQLIRAAKTSFVQATGTALLVASATLGVGALLVFVLAPRKDGGREAMCRGTADS